MLSGIYLLNRSIELIHTTLYDERSPQNAAVDDITFENDFCNVTRNIDFLGLRGDICSFLHADIIFILEMTRFQLVWPEYDGR